MSVRTLLRGCGPIVSGTLDAPILEADSLLIEDGRIARIGQAIEAPEGTRVVDLGGCTLIPGLIDAHSHPVLGDYTPRQHTVGWVSRVVHGGVTTLISAGETHWPGRTKDGPEAVAICEAAYLSSRLRAAGSARVHGGALLLDRGVDEADIDRLDARGITKLGEIGLGSEKDTARIAELVAHARSLGWVAPLHFGGASVPGSSVVALDMALAVKPSVISHANGGPTARPVSEVTHLIDHTDAAIELVFAGSSAAMRRILEHSLAEDTLHRLQFGTDTPSGTGVVPLGMLRVLTEAVTFSGLPPAAAICLATGTTAERYGIERTGRIEAGAVADLVILDNPLGSEAEDALDAMRIGNVPAVAGVFVDGEPTVRGSAATPPPTRNVNWSGV